MCIVAKSHCLTVRLKILGVVSHQTLIISLQNWVTGSSIFNIYSHLLQLITKSVQLIALNLPVVYRYRDCGLVDGVQKLSCSDVIKLYVTIPKYTKLSDHSIGLSHKQERF